MLRHAMAVGAMALCLVGLGGCASRDEEEETGPSTSERMDAVRAGIGDAAVTPLRDVGLLRPEIPDILESIRYPYDTATLASGCMAVAYEIGQLDAVLGEENYQPGPRRDNSERAADAAQDAAIDAVRGAADVIPFRGWVRQLSGATRAEREAIQAYEMGQIRRSFLRGYGASLGCRGVLPQPPPESDRHPAR